MRVHGCARVVSCAVLTAVLSVPASAASAGTKPLPTSEWVPLAVLVGTDPGTAVVSARYRCAGGTPTEDLWASVKQGPGSAGVGDMAARPPVAWYDQPDAAAKAGLVT